MSDRVTRTTRLTICLGLAVVMSGCAGQGEVNPGSGASEPASTLTSTPGECGRVDSYSGRFVVGNPEPQRAPAFVPIEPGTEIPLVAVPTLSSVAIDSTPDGSVVTYTVRGDGTIGWTARFVATAQLRGTGDTVPITGVCRLQIDLTGVDSNSVDVATEQPNSVTPDGDGSPVAEVLTYRSSDSLLQSFVGIDDAEPAVTLEAVEGSAALRVTISS